MPPHSRKAAVQTVLQQLKTEHCVTLTGAPGVGKTWIGNQVVAKLQETDPDLAVFKLQFTPGHNDDPVSVLWDLAGFLASRGGRNQEPWQEMEKKRLTGADIPLKQFITLFSFYLLDQNYLLVFDDVHRVLESPAQKDLLKLFRTFTTQLGTTNLLLMGRRPLPGVASQFRFHLDGLSDVPPKKWTGR